MPSTEVSSEEIDWFENSHCLKLNLMQNPDSMHSADAEDLFAGRSGRGIYTAEQIAAEQMAATETSDETLNAVASDDDEGWPPQVEGEPSAVTPKTSKRTSPAKSASQKPAASSKAVSGTGRVFTGTPKGKGTFK